jgi:AhpD family alkylhydroperoxidase
MSARIEYDVVAPDSTKGLTEIARYVRSGPLAPTLVELVMLRASQINGCAYCLDLHYRRARRAGVPQAQLDTLPGWEESPAFSDKERAALAWTDSLTRVYKDHVPDSAWDLVKAHFSEREIVDLSIAIVEINAWNRLMIAFRTPPTFGLQGRPSPAASSPPVASSAARSTDRPAPSS